MRLRSLHVSVSASLCCRVLFGRSALDVCVSLELCYAALESPRSHASGSVFPPSPALRREAHSGSAAFSLLHLV